MRLLLSIYTYADFLYIFCILWVLRTITYTVIFLSSRHFLVTNATNIITVDTVLDFNIIVVINIDSYTLICTVIDSSAHSSFLQFVKVLINIVIIVVIVMMIITIIEVNITQALHRLPTVIISFVTSFVNSLCTTELVRCLV